MVRTLVCNITEHAPSLDTGAASYQETTLLGMRVMLSRATIAIDLERLWVASSRIFVGYWC